MEYWVYIYCSKDFLVSEYFTENTVSVMTLGLTILEANALFIEEWFFMNVKDKIDKPNVANFAK